MCNVKISVQSATNCRKYSGLNIEYNERLLVYRYEQGNVVRNGCENENDVMRKTLWERNVVRKNRCKKDVVRKTLWESRCEMTLWVRLKNLFACHHHVLLCVRRVSCGVHILVDEYGFRFVCLAHIWNYTPSEILCLFVTITCTGDTAALWQNLVIIDFFFSNDKGCRSHDHDVIRTRSRGLYAWRATTSSVTCSVKTTGMLLQMFFFLDEHYARFGIKIWFYFWAFCNACVLFIMYIAMKIKYKMN